MADDDGRIYQIDEVPPDLQLVIQVVRETNMGDHAERLATVYEFVPDEPVETLIRRVLPELSSGWQTASPTTEVVLRLVVGTDGAVLGQAPRASVAPFAPF